MSNPLVRSNTYTSSPLKRSKYRLLGLVGQGQFGRVFCASHRKTGRLVALKELDHQRFPTHKFLRELRFLLSLQHPNIVTCHALEHTRTGRYLVMDYCEGGTLRTLMEGDAHLTLAQGVKLILDTLAGLAHAHSRGIVHCDIKPENILLSAQPTGWLARISDFGIARLSQELAQAAGNTGSPAYMAPERFYGQYSHSSDLYAVGVLFFELLMGYRPFSGTPGELMLAHLNHSIHIPEVVSSAIGQVILTALQKLPARRFASAAEMLSATQAAIAQDFGAEDSLASIYLPLIPASELPLTTCPFVSQRQDVLSAKIHGFAVDAVTRRSPRPTTVHSPQTACLYRNISTAQRGKIEVEPLIADSSPDQPEQPLSKMQIEFSEPIQHLVARPQTGFAIASHSIHRFHVKSAPETTHSPVLCASEQLATFDTAFVSTVDPQGHWLAAATSPPNQATGKILLWQQRQKPHPSTPRTFACQSPCPTQILALDARHLVVLSQAASHHTDEHITGVVSGGNKALLASCHITGSSGTLLEGFTRRGTQLGSWLLPIALQQVIPGVVPYRLLGLEKSQATSVLLIDLKPLRVRRIRVAIKPTLAIATPWGYILADAQGQMVLLDESGQQVGQIAAPATADLESDTATTAIAAVSSFEILMANWSPTHQQGHLYHVDLRELEIDLLF